MNKQRKVVITTTYNEMGIIIDTKAEELGSFVQPEPCEDAVSRKAVIDVFYELWGTSLTRKVNAINDLPTVTPKQPEQHTDTLKAEIRRMKRSFTTCINSDYYTGYMSALSAVEGYIAKMEGEAE